MRRASSLVLVATLISGLTVSAVAYANGVTNEQSRRFGSTRGSIQPDYTRSGAKSSLSKCARRRRRGRNSFYDSYVQY